MAIDEEVYGPYHPKVAADFHNWAVLLHRQVRTVGFSKRFLVIRR